MADQEQDKSEQPTRYKLEKAREKGVVARGVDLGFFAGLLAFFGYAWLASPMLSSALTRAARDAWISGFQLADGNNAVMAASAALFALILRPLAFLIGVIFLTVLLFELVQTGFVISADPLSVDFSRLSPVNGLKRVFSMRALIETLKNVLKLVLYLCVAYFVIRAALASDLGSVRDAPSLAAQLKHGLLRLLATALLAAAFFAVLDQLIVRGTFLKRMRMSRRELRREMRDREGEPRLKQKRKQLHREYTKTSQSLRNVRKADVIITNPQHIAVGLRYDPQSMQAPTVIAVGVNHVAQRLKRLALLYNIPVVERRALAQLLYRKTPLNGTIPADLYRPVADIYNVIRAQKARSERPHD